MGSASGGATNGLRLGVALTGGLSRAQLDELCAALAAELRAPVSGVGVWYYHRLVEAMAIGDVDVAWLPPIPAAQAMSHGHAIPIALPVRGGVTSYSTALFTRTDAPWRTVAELVGVRGAWVDRQSASGYLLIRAHLRALGLDLERAFSADRFTGSHEDVAASVLDGSADVGASFVHLDPVDERPVRAAWGSLPVRMLALAGPIPADVIAVSSRLDRVQVELVRRAFIDGRHALLRSAARKLLGAEGFVAPRPGHLDAVAALLPRLDDNAIPRPASFPRY
ncbi:Phosphonate ABC transporter phosphate-binding periplasmic component [Minicystis rosea]|nr:Phosphonate ABC transporter phosphate-binding periplasmic component [Minicystis rosea]